MNNGDLFPKRLSEILDRLVEANPTRDRSSRPVVDGQAIADPSKILKWSEDKPRSTMPGPSRYG